MNFTSLTDEKANSRIAEIPIGKLNVMSHASLIRCLDESTDFGMRIAAVPYNAPTAPNEWRILNDDEGLRWAVNYGTLPVPSKLRHAFSAICLDDSALKRDLLMSDDTVYENFRRQWGDLADLELVKSIKDSFEPVSPIP